jgi:hypothetical protein
MVSGLLLTILPDIFAVCRLEPDEAIPEWAFTGDFCSVTKTTQELSIVCKQNAVPPRYKTERDWRALKVEGPLDFSLTGILAALAVPLGEADISLFAVATYDTDYVLVKSEMLDKAIEVLEKAGHRVIL